MLLKTGLALIGLKMQYLVGLNKLQLRRLHWDHRGLHNGLDTVFLVIKNADHYIDSIVSDALRPAANLFIARE
jgi:hypothetical protein